MHEEWLQVDAVDCVLDGVHRMPLLPKVFQSGSRGWHTSQKVVLGDERCQVSICITVIGSKPKQVEPVAEGKPVTSPSKGTGSSPKRRKATWGGETLSDGSKALETTGRLPEVG